VRLAHDIPLDTIGKVYLNKINSHAMGSSNKNPRILLIGLMVKYMLNFSDDDTMQMDSEDLYILILPRLREFQFESAFRFLLVRGVMKVYGNGAAERN
jgi:hypothetical protein